MQGQATESWWVWAMAACAFVSFIMMIVVLKRYRRVGPDEAMIIYGATPGGIPRVILRGGGFVIPIVQRAEILSLKVFPIEVLTPASPAKDGGSVAVDAVAQVKVHATPESVRAAAEKFHDVGRDMVIDIVRGLLQNQVRRAVAGMNSADIGLEHTALAGLIMTSAGSDVAPMGLELVTVNVRSVQNIRK